MKAFKLLSLLLVLLLGVVAFSQETAVTLAPSWGDSFRYAFQAGYGLFFAFGLILLAVAVILFVLLTASRIQISPVFIVLALILAGASLWSQPSSIKFNNDKVVTQSLLDYHKGNGKEILDSLAANGEIVSGPNKK